MADTALEKAAERTPAVITTPEEFRTSLQRWQQERFNILTPFARISGLAQQHGIVTSVIQINVDKSFGEVYDGLPFLKSDEVALAKNGLRKIAEGLGISVRLEYLSTGATVRHFWHVKAVASYRGIDGAPIEREASEEWDLRDGSDRLKGWKQSQIEEGRKHGLRNCETRAINAAIRECGCGVKQAYKRAELERPFLAVRVAFQPDLSDPETRRQVTAAALSGARALYPAAPAHASRDAFEEAGDERAVRDAGRGSTAAATASQAPAKAEDQPPTPDAVRIVKVEEKPFTYNSGARKGQQGTRFIVIDSTGLESSTFDQKLADLARKCAAERTWVEINTETQGQYTNLIEITIAGENPRLPDMGRL